MRPININNNSAYYRWLISSSIPSFVLVNPISDVAENLGRYLSCTAQGNDFEFILTVKMETRHPVEGSFGS